MQKKKVVIGNIFGQKSDDIWPPMRLAPCLYCVVGSFWYQPWFFSLSTSLAWTSWKCSAYDVLTNIQKEWFFGMRKKSKTKMNSAPYKHVEWTKILNDILVCNNGKIISRYYLERYNVADQADKYKRLFLNYALPLPDSCSKLSSPSLTLSCNSKVSMVTWQSLFHTFMQQEWFAVGL